MKIYKAIIVAHDCGCADLFKVESFGSLLTRVDVMRTCDFKHPKHEESHVDISVIEEEYKKGERK